MCTSILPCVFANASHSTNFLNFKFPYPLEKDPFSLRPLPPPSFHPPPFSRFPSPSPPNHRLPHSIPMKPTQQV